MAEVRDKLTEWLRDGAAGSGVFGEKKDGPLGISSESHLAGVAADQLKLFLAEVDEQHHDAVHTLQDMAAWTCAFEAVVRALSNPREGEPILSVARIQELTDKVHALRDKTVHSHCMVGVELARKRAGYLKVRPNNPSGCATRSLDHEHGGKYHKKHVEDGQTVLHDLQKVLAELAPNEPWSKALFQLVAREHTVPTLAKLKDCSEDEINAKYIDKDLAADKSNTHESVWRIRDHPFYSTGALLAEAMSICKIEDETPKKSALTDASTQKDSPWRRHSFDDPAHIRSRLNSSDKTKRNAVHVRSDHGHTGLCGPVKIKYAKNVYFTHGEAWIGRSDEGRASASEFERRASKAHVGKNVDSEDRAENLIRKRTFASVSPDAESLLIASANTPITEQATNATLTAEPNDPRETSAKSRASQLSPHVDIGSGSAILANARAGLRPVVRSADSESPIATGSVLERVKLRRVADKYNVRASQPRSSEAKVSSDDLRESLQFQKQWLRNAAEIVFADDGERNKWRALVQKSSDLSQLDDGAAPHLRARIGIDREDWVDQWNKQSTDSWNTQFPQASISSSSSASVDKDLAARRSGEVETAVSHDTTQTEPLATGSVLEPVKFRRVAGTSKVRTSQLSGSEAKVSSDDLRESLQFQKQWLRNSAEIVFADDGERNKWRALVQKSSDLSQLDDGAAPRLRARTGIDREDWVDQWNKQSTESWNTQFPPAPISSVSIANDLAARQAAEVYSAVRNDNGLTVEIE